MASVDDYLALVTAEHADKPNFIAVLTALLQPVVDEINMLSSIPPGYDLDLAVGAQLDVVGQWVGLSRKLKVPLSGVYFSFGIAGVGFGQGVWKGPFDPTEGVVSLDDDTYRTMLYIKIAANYWDGSLSQAQAILALIFANVPGCKFFIQDNFDMSMTIGIAGTQPSTLLLSLLNGGYITLRPAAVSIKEVVVPSVGRGPIFGFGVNNAYIGGFGSGSWAKKI